MKKENVKKVGKEKIEYFGCEHTKEKISQYIISPLDIKLKKFLKEIEYFLYYAPNIAFKKIKINEIKWNEIYEDILQLDESLLNNHKEYYRKSKIDYYSLLGLDGDRVCLECSRLVISKSKNENNLTALLRHLRNSLAHGLCYIKQSNKKYYMLFEDICDGNITARMVLELSRLKEIKEYIETQINRN